jgi:hydrophobe/amphiphile efflux-3 (HAE3) family protein
MPENDVQKEVLRQALIKNEFANGVVVSTDFRYTIIMGTVKEDVEDKQIISRVEDLLVKYPGDEKVYRGGMPFIRDYIDKDIKRDMLILLPIALVLMLLILYFSFREMRGVVLPFSVVVCSIIFSMGLIALFGWKLSLISILLPIMMIAIANNYGIHIIARYQELYSRYSNLPMIRISGIVFKRLKFPVILTGLTTIAGILGLLAHTIIPARELGIIAAIGITFALILSLLFIPSVISFLKKGYAHEKAQNNRLTIILEKLGLLIRDHTRKVLIVSGIACLLIGAGIFLIKVDTNIENFFPDNHPVKISSNIINTEFGGSQNIAVMFTGDIKQPELLKRLDYYETELKKQPGVGQVISIASVIKEMSKALNDPVDPGYDAIPDSRAAVAQYLELYSMSGDPEDFEQFVDFDYTKALLILRLDDASNSVIKSVMTRIDELTQNDPAKSIVGGYALTTVELADLVVNGQAVSLILAVLAVACLVMVIFRSFSAGIVAAIPLAFAIIFLFGLMGIFHIRLDIVTAMLSSIMIGVGVDYTIHYLWRYREEVQNGLPHSDAMLKTLVTTGRGITFNAVSVMIGFSVLFLSTFIPIQMFGFLIVVSILTCLIGAMIIVPAVLLTWKPAFIERKMLGTKIIIENEKIHKISDDRNTDQQRSMVSN